MIEVRFEYKDKHSHGEWRSQRCRCRSLKECMDFYGLGIDCEYRIVSIIPL